MISVLVVDDMAAMRLIIRKHLARNGYNVVGEAADGEDAVTEYERLWPDLVIMDISMPGRNDGTSTFSTRRGGIDAIKDIIKINPEAKILVCSALGSREIVLEAVKAGAKDYILKPITSYQLLAVVNKLFS